MQNLKELHLCSSGLREGLEHLASLSQLVMANIACNDVRQVPETGTNLLCS